MIARARDDARRRAGGAFQRLRDEFSHRDERQGHVAAAATTGSGAERWGGGGVSNWIHWVYLERRGCWKHFQRERWSPGGGGRGARE